LPHKFYLYLIHSYVAAPLKILLLINQGIRAGYKGKVPTSMAMVAK
jgi:hypothetical protein